MKDSTLIQSLRRLLAENLKQTRSIKGRLEDLEDGGASGVLEGDVSGTADNNRVARLASRVLNLPDPVFFGDDFEDGLNEDMFEIDQNAEVIGGNMVITPPASDTGGIYATEFFDFTGATIDIKIDSLVTGEHASNRFTLFSGNNYVRLDVTDDLLTIRHRLDNVGDPNELMDDVVWIESYSRLRFAHDTAENEIVISAYLLDQWLEIFRIGEMEGQTVAGLTIDAYNDFVDPVGQLIIDEVSSDIMRVDGATDGAALVWDATAKRIVFGAASPTAQTLVFETESLENNAEEEASLTLPKTFLLLSVVASRASRIRTYSSVAFRAADAGRIIGDIPDTPHGVISDDNLLAENLIGNSHPIPTGTNAENPRSNLFPIKIQNKSGVTGTVEVTFTYLSIEA